MRRTGQIGWPLVLLVLAAVVVGNGHRSHLGRTCARSATLVVASDDSTSPAPRGRAAHLLLDQIEGSFREIYLTLMSIIQGVALGVLYQTISDDRASMGPVEWARAAYILLIAVVIWQEYMIGATAWAWVPTVLDSAAPFALGATEFALIFELRAASGPFFVAASVLLTAGVVASCNYLLHTRRGRGFALNRISHEVIGDVPRSLLFWALVSWVVAVTSAAVLSLVPASRTVVLAITAANGLPVLMLATRTIWRFNLPIWRVRRRHESSWESLGVSSNGLASGTMR